LTFANFIFAVFLLLSAIVVMVLIMLIRQIRKDGNLPEEKMNTVVALLFIPAIIIFALVFKGITDWRGEIQQQQERLEISQFVERIYTPLATSQQSLRDSFVQMRTLLREIDELEITYSNHAKMISTIRKEWSAAQLVLFNTFNDTDKEVRRAWIAHNTMDQEDVLAKFSKQAVYLEENLQKAEREYELSLHSSHDKLIKNLDGARKLIDSNRKPPRKKQRLLNKDLLENLQPFNDRITADLTTYIASIDSRLKVEIETLQELIRLSGQQVSILKTHLRKNADLEKPLTIVINRWIDLEQKNRAQLKQVLYAIEAEYVARKLGLSAKSPALAALHKSLRINIPAMVGNALALRKSIDQSYKVRRDF
jgi:hypothetical protein